ncbi:hypothetical protein [Alkaliphilus serpentinus]|uniref:Uncharacterized protein n=1 Tax=Alkaliphilus serpentinus TaxID=1482731 RepID=A0A833HPK6_9FIRM|nr:hypothetical protein [Alkaliphilus serpentinus]KAB3531065.1 hypothetical protein F8153_05360 [Alkaliphilus serpentinus]
MKRIIAMVLMVCIVALGGGSVYAHTVEEATPLEENLNVFEGEGGFKGQRGQRRFDIIKELRDEIQQLNQLKIQRLELKIEVTERQGTILDLTINARENQMKEELQQAKEVRQEIKDIHDQLKEYREEVKAEVESFREAVKNHEIEEAREHIENIINIKTTINSMISEKILLLDEIIEILTVEI